MSQPSVDLDQLHDAIIAALAAQFPTATVDDYPRPGERIATPGILLELDDMPAEDPDDIGTEQLPVVLNFAAYIVHDYKAGKKRAVRKLAAAVMTHIRGKRWGVPVGAATVGGAYRDKIEGRENDYEVMRVEFSHSALLGTDIWQESGPMPVEAYASRSPEIGPDHVDDYELVGTTTQAPP